jgi:hypothetical protein
MPARPRPPYPVTGIVYSPDGVLSVAELARFGSDATQWIGDVVAPWWARYMAFHAQDPGAPLDPLAPQIAFAHHETVEHALGHHWAQQGALRALVAVDEAGGAPGGWRRTGFHEAGEMDVDPSGLDVRQVGNLLLPVEICDAVEDDNSEASNIVTPAWFDAQMAAAGVAVDDAGALPRGADVDGVLPMTPGGYCSYFDLTNPSAGWQERDARGNARLSPPWSRLARKLARLAPHASHWRDALAGLVREGRALLDSGEG